MDQKNTLGLTISGDEVTGKFPVNDIFCTTCRALLAKVLNYRHIQLEGWDRKVLFDSEKGTATVRCKCGTCRVIRPKGDSNEGEKESLNVWLEEIGDSDSGVDEIPDEGSSTSE